MTNNTKGLLYAATAGFLWGILAVVIKIVLNYIPPKTIAWSRFIIAFVLLFISMLFYNPKSLKIFFKPPWLVIVSAISIGFNYIFFMEGINITTPNNAAIFIQAGPILLAIIGFVFYKEKLKWVHIIGLLIAFSGFIFFYHDQMHNLFQNNVIYNKGVFYIVLAGIFWTVYSVIQKELIKKYTAEELNLINFGLPVLILLPGAEFRYFFEVPWFALLILLFLGVNTLLAYRCLSMALKYTEANKVSVILTANPTLTFLAMAVLTGLNVSWITGEVFSVYSLMGAFLVISGAIIVSIFKGKN